MNDRWDKITKKWTSYPEREYIIENLKEHQQISIIISDVLIIALFSGVLINIFSDALITIIKGQHSVLDVKILLVTFSAALFAYLYYKRKLVYYRPARPTYSIHFSLDSLLLEGIKEKLNQKTFYKEEFETWYSIFEEKIIEYFINNPFLSKYEFKQSKVDQDDYQRNVSLISDKILKTSIEIQTTPYESSEQFGKIRFYYDINFIITISVLQPRSHESRSFVNNIYLGTPMIMSRIENEIVTTFSTLPNH